MARRKSRYIFVNEKETHPVRNFFLGLLLMLILIVLSVGIFNYAVCRQVRYETLSVTVPKLPDDLENWTILQFSDLQGNRYGHTQSGIASAIGTVNVSSIVFTGDMIGKDGDIEPLLQLAACLPADKPKLLLMGDEDPAYLDAAAHESFSPLSDWAVKLTEAGITILDEPVLFTRGRNDRARIWFVPASLYTLDLDGFQKAYQNQLDRLETQGRLTADEAAQKRVAQYQVERVERIRTAIASILPTDVQIAVTHVPVTPELMSASMVNDKKNDVFTLRRADLILAGHYCGGHWQLPGVGVVYVPGMGFNPMDERVVGFSYLNSVPQYISTGLGTSAIYDWWESFRLMNAPSVACITLTHNMVR